MGIRCLANLIVGVVLVGCSAKPTPWEESIVHISIERIEVEDESSLILVDRPIEEMLDDGHEKICLDKGRDTKDNFYYLESIFGSEEVVDVQGLDGAWRLTLYPALGTRPGHVVCKVYR
jgi:hypothetical protein